MLLELTTPQPYDFERSINDHGWIQLAPNYWDSERKAMRRVERLTTGKVVLLYISAQDAGAHVRIVIHVEGDALTDAEQDEIRRSVHWMLKLNEDLTPFYQRCQAQNPALWERLCSGRGRLLRSPTMWEDIVKTICTTNTTWRQTISMNDRIVNTLGDPYPPNPELRAFPTPEQVATADQALFTNVIRLGYRSDYVRQLAREIVTGERDVEALKHTTLPPKELRKVLKTIKGVGDYAANTLLMLLGSYADLAIDTEVRALVSRVYFNGENVTEAQIQETYRAWDEWKYLAYWFDA